MFLGLDPYSFVLEVSFLIGHILNVVCCSFVLLKSYTLCNSDVLTSVVSEVLLGSD